MIAHKATVLEVLQVAIQEWRAAPRTFKKRFGPGLGNSDSRGRFVIEAFKGAPEKGNFCLSIVPDNTGSGAAIPTRKRDLDKHTREIVEAVEEELRKAGAWEERGINREGFAISPETPGAWWTKLVFGPR